MRRGFSEKGCKQDQMTMRREELGCNKEEDKMTKLEEEE